MSADVTPGRRHQRVPIFSVGVQTAFMMGVLVVLALVVWHLALATTSGVPYGDYAATVRGLVGWTPLTVPEQYSPPNTALTLMLFGALMVAVPCGLYFGWRWLKRTLTPVRTTVGVADKKQTRRSAGELRARKKAAWTRRASVLAGTLDTNTSPLAEIGLLLGTGAEHGEPVVLALEDQAAIMAATGMGKDLYLMIGACIDAPGPLVVTSTGPEMLDAIATTRGKVGRVWVFDPLDMARWHEPMIWDPTAHAEISQNATALGEAFSAGFSVDNGSTQFFMAASARVIARLLHAAALGGKDIQQVLTWALNLARSQEALEILNGDPRAEILWAETLRGASEGADDTVASTRMTLGQKVDPMLSRLVLRQLLPTPGVDQFDPAEFVQSMDTLVLITDDQAQTNVAPLTTMLLGAVVDAAKVAAAISMTGVLDPPLRIVGNEMANVAPLPKLPGLLSDSRGKGMQWIIAFQSLSQVFARWGEDEGRQIMANLNCSLVLGGLQDERALERFSALVGEVELTEVSASLDGMGVSSGHSISTSERTALRPEEIRQLPDGQALAIYRNAPAMIVDLIRWVDRPDGKQIAEDMQRTRKIRTTRQAWSTP
jgi:hypothetical protein